MFKNYCFKNISFNKRELKDLVSQYYIKYGISKASCLLDSLKDLGFYFATQSSISLAIEDLKVPPTKKILIETTNRNINLTNLEYLRGKITNVERFQKVIDTWNQTNDDLKTEVVRHFKKNDSLNPIYLMAFSGARGNLSQVHQLVGMRGLMADPNGQIIDLPIEANFREGLKITDYIISSYGARKGIVDTALKTADSGYLTRRLVDVAQHVIIREIDCHTQMGVLIKGSFLTSSNLIGRVLINNISKNTELLIKKTKEITLPFIILSKNSLISDLVIKSPLTCISSRSICQKCYGWNLSQTNLVEIGEAIGIIAAQSIGEPGTQLTMRTFHTGGVFSNESKKQIRSKYLGKIIFSHLLNLKNSRTIYGEKISTVENFAEFYLIKKTVNLIKFLVSPNIILFIKNRQNVGINQLMAEIPLVTKQFIEDTKNIIADLSGEVKFQNIRITTTDNLQTKILKDGVLWIVGGNILNTPQNGKINLKDYQFVDNHSKISLKIFNKTSGILKLNPKNDKNEDEKELNIIRCLAFFDLIMTFKSVKNSTRNFYFVTKNNKLFKLNYAVKNKKFEPNEIAKQILFKYFLKIEGKIFKSLFGPVQSSFVTYGEDYENELEKGGKILILPLEHYAVNRDKNISLVSQNKYILSQTELVPNVYSKNEGLVKFDESDNILTNIYIYYGKLGNLIYLDKSFYSNFQAGECFYPGEILFNTIEVQFLTKIDITNIIEIGNNNYEKKFCKVELFLQPIVQCTIPKTITYHKYLTTEEPEEIGIMLKKRLLVEHNEIVYCGRNKSCKIIDSYLEIKRITNVKNTQSVNILYFIANETKDFIQFCFYEKETIFLTKDLFENSTYNYIIINPLIKDNQFIEAYTEVATIHNITTKSDDLKKIKRNKTKLDQLIYTSENTYIPKGLLESKQSDMVGYKNFKNQINNTIYDSRIGQPYFISRGTVMYVNHGDFITKNKLICLLVYEKIISGDIIQGLPKIEQILESRISKLATKLVSEPGLIIKIYQTQLSKLVILTRKKINNYLLKSFNSINLQIGSILAVGQPLESGSINPHLILHVYFNYYSGLFSLYEATYRSFINAQILLVNSIQNVYKSQGITISDKHVEVIIKQMSSKVQIMSTNSGSAALPGTIIPIQQINYMNFALKLENHPILDYRPILLGITRTSLGTESFLSAASFQETTKILTQAATEGKIDWLRGLKENVIMGKLMPSGTGFTVFNPLNSLRLMEKFSSK